MAAIGASRYLAEVGLSPFYQRLTTSYRGGIQKRLRVLAVSTERIEKGRGSAGENGRFENKKKKQKMVKEETDHELKPNIYANPDELPEVEEAL
ncbi:hypothetical protein REPUB_Repub09cG0005200 [Reevesia pubescens]